MKKQLSRGRVLPLASPWCCCFAALTAGTPLILPPTPRPGPQLRDFQVDHQKPRLAEVQDLLWFLCVRSFSRGGVSKNRTRGKRKKRGKDDTTKRKKKKKKKKEEKRKLASCTAITSSSGAETSADQKTPLSSSK